ncbi:hypothetical protein SAMN05216486_10549 [bacterium JGI 053]|nr:hypothetical protein SAMN05216486_10549 [bacterium JGI 053]
MTARIWIALSLSLTAFLAGGSLPALATAQAGLAAVVSGRVIPAGGDDVRGVRVFARQGALSDSAEVDSAGRFSLVLPSVATDSLELWVDGGAPGTAAFHPARLRLGRAELAREQEIVLVPLRWTIQAGRYATHQVDVRLARAFSRPCASCTGFFRGLAARADSGRTGLQGWPADRFPLRVAFDREWNGEKVSPGDSAAFWRETDELEETLGADVFRPANLPDAAPREDGGPNDVILVWFDPDMGGIGGIGTAVSEGEDIGYGDLRLNRAALRGDVTTPGLVSHELLHTLGFGHTCAWRSVVADVRRCPYLRASSATEDDVAYVELAAEIRSLLRERHGRWALEAALAAMDAPPAPAVAVRSEAGR